MVRVWAVALFIAGPWAGSASACDAVPRTILALFDASRDGTPLDTRIHRFVALPLNHMGYRLQYVDVSATGPAMDAADWPTDGVAAVLSWFETTPVLPPGLTDRLLSYRDPCGTRPARIVLGGAGLPGGDAFAPVAAPTRVGIGARVLRLDEDVFANDVPFGLQPGRYPAVRADTPSDSLLRIRTPEREIDLALVSDRGGYAHGSAVIAEDPRGGAFWVLDPFAFFDRILTDAPWPVPDATTRNGRRIFLSTLDGGGWTDPLPDRGAGAAAPLAGPVALERFIEAYPDLPVTVAFDADSFDPSINPGLAERVSSDAARLAAMPNVRLASIRGGPGPDPATLDDDLPLSLILARDLRASGEDANRPALYLAPSAFDPWAPLIAGLAPLTAPVGPAGRVLAPLALAPEELSFLALPGLLDRTETPRRLAAFHLVYPARVVTDHARRTAVEAYLDLAKTEAFAPLYTDDYVGWVRGWQAARIVPVEPRRWRILDRGALQTVRFDGAARSALDMAGSAGVLGARRHGAALYVSLDPDVAEPVVALTAGSAANGLAGVPDAPVLSDARGPVRRLRRTGCETEIVLVTGGETVWWAAPERPIDVAWLRDGKVVRTDRIVTGFDGRATVDAGDIPPRTVLRLRASCASP